MKRTGRKTLCMVLTLLLALPTLAGLTAVAEGEPEIVASGYCGNTDQYTHYEYLPGDIGYTNYYPDFGTNASWTLYSDGTFIVSGSGAVAGIDCLDEIEDPEGIVILPWRDYRDQVKKIVIEEGIESIGRRTFAECKNAETILLPESLETVGAGAFSGNGAVTVTIPAGVKRMSYNSFVSSALTDYIVSPDNTAYSSVDGVLFDKAQTTLISFPYAKTGIDYTIPEGVTTIGSFAFDGCRLTGLTIPDTVTSVDSWWTFASCIVDGVLTIGDAVDVDLLHAFAAIRNIDVTPGCTNYSSIDGVLFNKEQTELLYYPDSRTATAYRIPDGVLRIAGNAISDNSYLETLLIPGDLERIGPAGVYSCENLYTVYYAGSADRWDLITEPYFSAVWYGTTAGSLYSARIRFVEYVDGHFIDHVDASEATEDEHGYTEGVYCADTDTWLSGHEVIHNTLGEMTVLKEPTAEESGECIITCTVCGERGYYAMDPVPADPTNEPIDPTEPEEDNSFVGRIKRAMQSVINFFLRILRWLGGNK